MKNKRCRKVFNKEQYMKRLLLLSLIIPLFTSCSGNFGFAKEMSKEDIDRVVAILSSDRTLLSARINSVEETPNTYFQSSSFNKNDATIEKRNCLSENEYKNERSYFINQNDTTKRTTSTVILENGNKKSEEESVEEIEEDYFAFVKRFTIDNSFISDFCNHVESGRFVGYSSKWKINNAKLFLKEGVEITIKLYDQSFTFANIESIYAYVSESKRGGDGGPSAYTNLDINGMVDNKAYKTEFNLHYSTI